MSALPPKADIYSAKCQRDCGCVPSNDFYNYRVQKLTADGTFLTAFGGKGNGPGQFYYVTAVAVAEDGTVFAADYGNNRIQKWRSMADMIGQ